MKNFSLLIVLFFIYPTISLAQDTTLSVTSDGNVGIGTSNPQEKLEIRSSSPSIRIVANNANTSSIQLYEISGGNPFGYEFQYDGSVDKLYLWSRGFSGNEDIRMSFLKGGRVGIGTTTPASELDVNGTVTISGAHELNRTRTGNANLVPIAYANVNEDGSINTGASTDNVNFYPRVPGSGNYYFDIAGYFINDDDFIVIATLSYGPGEIYYNWFGSDQLYIGTCTSAGVSIDLPFNFVIYKK